MRIQVNGEAREVPTTWSVRALLDDLCIPRDRRVAVAVNRQVVPSSAHPSHPLADGDRVEILEAVGGG